MKFYDETKPLNLETDASGIGLGTTLSQTRDGTTCPKDNAPDNTILRPILFTSKTLTSAEQKYSNIERGALGILHGLNKFHHYWYVREISIITDHQPLVAIFKKDVATLVTVNPVHSPQDAPIPGQNNVQARAGDLHCIIGCPNRITWKTKIKQ